MGRLPVVVTLDKLDEDALVRILTEPKNALVRQYTKLMRMDGAELEFTDEALRAIAQQAIERKSGARGLRAIIEGILLDIMFELPVRDDVKKCIVTEETVRKHKEPELELDASPTSRTRRAQSAAKPELPATSDAV